MSLLNGQLMRLELIQPQFVDFAWRDGASCLAEACDLVEEITGDQLKMILSRGERLLWAMKEGDKTVGWGCTRVDQLPNLRVLHITDLVAHNGGFERFFEEIKKVAHAFGCSRVRCSCHQAQARLYRMKCGFTPVYETVEVVV